jgi:hypothetical protein
VWLPFLRATLVYKLLVLRHFRPSNTCIKVGRRSPGRAGVDETPVRLSFQDNSMAFINGHDLIYLDLPYALTAALTRLYTLLSVLTTGAGDLTGRGSRLASSRPATRRGEEHNSHQAS